MAVRDLADYFDSGLDYPNVPSKLHPEGKTYRVESPDAATGLWLTQLAHLGGKAAFGLSISASDLASLKLDDDQERDLYQRVMGCTSECRAVGEDGTVGAPCGSTYDEMVADAVAWTVLQKIAQDAYLFFAIDEAMANTRLGSPGEAPARANRATRRTAAKTAGRKSARASTASGSRTPKPASTASSTSPKPRKGKAGAKSV